MGYSGVNLKIYLGTDLCRDERLMKHFSVIMLYLSGRREKKYPIMGRGCVCYVLVWFFFCGILDFLSFGHKLNDIS